MPVVLERHDGNAGHNDPIRVTYEAIIYHRKAALAQQWRGPADFMRFHLPGRAQSPNFPIGIELPLGAAAQQHIHLVTFVGFIYRCEAFKPCCGTVPCTLWGFIYQGAGR
jgi:hypothetical protein